MILGEGGNSVISNESKNIAALATNYDDNNKDNNCLTVDDIERSNFEFSENILLHAKRFLTLGLNKEDKIGILLFNSIEYLELMYGAMYAGLSPVCINARYKTQELDYVLKDSECKYLFISSESDEITNFSDLILSVLDTNDQKIDSLINTYVIGGSEDDRLLSFDDFLKLDISSVNLAEPKSEGEDIAFIMYTSGTTSNPKGCPLSHNNMMHATEAMSERWNISSNDVFWDPLPMFHMSSILPFSACLMAKSEFISTVHFDPDKSLRVLEEAEVSIAFPAFPAVMLALVNHPEFNASKLSKLRIINNVAPVDTLRSFQEALPGAKQVSAYGLTEASGVCAYGSPDDPLEKRITTSGRPFNGVKIRIIHPETGEVMPSGEKGLIEISGPTVFKGYLNDPIKTKETISSDGWLSTGDFGSLSEDGFISYHGRLKDMLKVGGENVAALEIESFYNNHEGVMISQVIGVDDERLGEVPALFIEKKDGVTITAEELIDSAKGKISNFKIPRYVVFVKDWPMSSTKVQKFKLKEYDLGKKFFG